MSIESLSDKVQLDNNPNDNGNVSKPMDKVQPENKSDDSGTMSEPMDKVQPENKSHDNGSASMSMDKIQPKNKSNDSETVSKPMDKVQCQNNSDDSGSVSIQKNTIQNDDIQVKVKVTNDANAEQESDGTDELFDDPLLIFLNKIWKLNSMSRNIMSVTLKKVMIPYHMILKMKIGVTIFLHWMVVKLHSISNHS